jgi:pimeloyl-ACP methyl ester carboxylesterase
LLFVHGAFAEAAVWDVHFLPYFAAQGYHAHALSLRGHGTSAGRERLRWHSLADYVADVEHAVRRLGQSPVLIGHSMGGMVIQKYLERYDAAGVVLMASAPPHGLLASLTGMWLSRPWVLYQLALIQHGGPRWASPALLRQALFSDNTPEASIRGYLPLFNGESQRVSWDMLGLNPLRLRTRPTLPLLVLGAEQDVFFSPGLVHDTARAYGARAVTFPDMGHAMMLERDWRAVAEHILAWLPTCLPGAAHQNRALD